MLSTVNERSPMPPTTDKRTAILEAALRLIPRQGFHATPVSQIAEEAGVAAGSIYRYFPSKETLLNQLYLELKHQVHQAMGEGLEPGLPFEAFYKRVWLNTCAYFIAHPDAFSFMEAYATSPFLTQETREAGLQALQVYVEAFLRARSEGLIQDLPLEVLFSFFHGPLASLAKKHLAGQLPLDADLCRQAAHASWCAIRR